jgi:cyanate permease
VGAGFAPATFGAIHDRLGSYTPVIGLSIGLLIAGTVLNFTLGRYPQVFGNADDTGGGRLSPA